MEETGHGFIVGHEAPVDMFITQTHPSIPDQVAVITAQGGDVIGMYKLPDGHITVLSKALCAMLDNLCPFLAAPLGAIFLHENSGNRKNGANIRREISWRRITRLQAVEQATEPGAEPEGQDDPGSRITNPRDRTLPREALGQVAKLGHFRRCSRSRQKWQCGFTKSGPVAGFWKSPATRNRSGTRWVG